MKINIADLSGAIIILISLYLIRQHSGWWLLYAFGCFLWILIHWSKKLYFGMLMNAVAMIIAIRNFLKG